MRRLAALVLALCVASCTPPGAHHDVFVRGCEERGLAFRLPEQVRQYCECMYGKPLDDGRLEATVAACSRPYRVVSARLACIDGCRGAPWCEDYCMCVARTADVASGAPLDDAHLRAAAAECSPHFD